MKRMILTLAALVLSAPAMAQQPAPAVALEPGQTVITLNATEQREIRQDLLMASLRIEIEDKDAKKLQDQINKAMQKAVADAKSYSDVKVSTGQYYVYSHDPNPQPVDKNYRDAKARMIWKGSQSVELRSKNQAALLELAGKIQELGFVMNNLNYTLSPEQSEAYRDTLMTDALQKIQKRAQLAAKALGKSGYDIMEVNVDGGYMQPVPVMYKSARMEMAAAGAADAMQAPSAEAGEQTVSLTVNARVLLKP